jgi:hypothetical protein
MAKLSIDVNSTFQVDVTVRESDKYSGLVYVKMERFYRPESIHGCNELFLTPSQLENLGNFLVRQAREIRTEQEITVR